MLDAPLEKWRIFLHPSQRQLVERGWNGPVRVLGGAGTGKTVVAMHRAAWLAREVFTGERDRILFTTFTANLAEDIAQSLDKLLEGAARKRVEVVHLDACVARFLEASGYDYGITYPDRPEAAKAWDEALASGPTAYFSALYQRGVGAGRPAPGLHVGGRLGQGAASRARRAPEPQAAQGDLAGPRRLPQPARGEEAERGGRRDARRGRAAAGVRVVGRSRRLRVNYRTTQQIRRFAVAQLEGVHVDDLDEGFDSVKGYLSLMKGPPPAFSNHPSLELEAQAIEAFARRRRNRRPAPALPLPLLLPERTRRSEQSLAGRRPPGSRHLRPVEPAPAPGCQEPAPEPRRPSSLPPSGQGSTVQRLP